MSTFGYKPRVGDRVRIMYEATVIERGPGDWDDEFRVQLDNKYGERMHRLDAVTVEKVLPELPPEPMGDVILVDREGDIWQKHATCTAWNHRSLDRGWAELIAEFGPMRVFREAS